jgi:hypothetical protein
MTLFILTILCSLIVIFFVPKRLSKLELYTSSLFAAFLGTIADVYLDVKFDWYGFFNKGADWHYIPILLFVYPAANILLLNFYPEHKRFTYKVLYILGFSCITLIFEYISLHTEIFYYNEWKLWYSAICYPFLYLILRLHLLLIREGIKNAQKSFNG